MNRPILLLACAVGAALPVWALLRRRLDLRRDLLFLAFYAQAFLYVQFGPWDYMRRTGDTSAFALGPAYDVLAIASVVLFNGLFLASYLYCRGDSPERPGSGFSVSPRTFTFVNAAFLGFAAGFWSIAIRSELVFRRIGNTIIPKQLTLKLFDFVVYRSYSEGVWFLACVVFAGLVVGGRRLTRLGITLALANLASVYLYLVINSRIGLGLALGLLVALWGVLWRGEGAYLPRLAAVAGVAGLILLYSTSTTERIRVGFGRTGGVTWRAFLPGLSLEERRAAAKIPGIRRHPPRGEGEGEAEGEEILGGGSNIGEAVSGMLLYRAAVETPLTLRLNGIDLMARMRPELESQGFAWGRAWDAPIALIYLPIVDPAEARRMKMNFDIAAKSYLMRRYTDIDQPDWFSCMLTDAYGNFGIPGIALVGLSLGAAVGLSTRGLTRPKSSWAPVVALFFVSHLFQFEQEFVTAAFLWIKKLPFLAAVLVVNPFTVRPGDRAAESPLSET